nr:MAG TPA: hypothetical protein [Microviridae sp.]
MSAKIILSLRSFLCSLLLQQIIVNYTLYNANAFLITYNFHKTQP